MSGVPPSDASSALPVESTLGATPARSSRYITEHSAHAPLAGQPELALAAGGGATAAFVGGVSDFPQATTTIAKTASNRFMNLHHASTTDDAGANTGSATPWRATTVPTT